MTEHFQAPIWLRFLPLTLGIAYAIYTTLPVLNPGPEFWFSDEGGFLEAGRAHFNLDIRYGLFGLLVKFYHLFTDHPFSIVLLHKLVVLCAFLAIFQKKVWEDHGAATFLCTFAAFLYLNGSFLRDSLIFLFTQLAVLYAFSIWTIRDVAGFVPLALLRPQNLLLFVPPWMSISVTAGFLILMRDRYTELQLRDQSFLAIFDKTLWLKGVGSVVTTVSNLNPLIKLPFFFERGLYPGYVLLLLGSVALFAVFIELALSLYRAEFRFAGWERLCAGLGCLLLMYGALAIPADIRIFFAAVCPFALRVKRRLLSWQVMGAIALIWLLMTLVRYTLRG